PASEFEVLFVDDGSGDGTADRLRAVAAERGNVRVIEIENSGWASRPRNVGIAAAVGEYVTFVDHDDSLFPDALRSAYEAGAAIGADFVNPKEVTDRGWSWGWDVWREDRQLTSREQIVPKDVTPLIPHKLYRREFLNEFGICFPEGPRAFWEDFYLNTEVFVHAESIAILASVPFYKWHRDTGSNSSDRIYESVEEYWAKLGDVARFMEEQVPDAAARRWLLINHYRWWVIDLFGPRMAKQSPEFIETSLPHMRAFLDRWVPENADDDLEAANAATAWLMRHSDLDHLRALAVFDGSRTARATTTTGAWTPQGFAITAQATWCGVDGEPLLFRRVGERLIRVLPAPLASVLPVDVIDVSDAIAGAWGGFSVRSRRDRTSWRIESEFESSFDERGDGAISLRVTLRAVIDPSTLVFGRALEDGIWDLGARFGFMGAEAHAAVDYSDGTKPAIRHGYPVIAYSTNRGALAFDIGGTAKQLVTPGRLDPTSVRRSGSELQINLRGLQMTGSGIGIEVRFGS
ncbi:MAG TPA: glycosyltransferase family 2 protein, partial [Thermomicrobiales bacterium]|nr:glycosyltransferase family 2 protein [Thermomicrobiales bacterium]